MQYAFLHFSLTITFSDKLIKLLLSRIDTLQNCVKSVSPNHESLIVSSDDQKIIDDIYEKFGEKPAEDTKDENRSQPIHDPDHPTLEDVAQMLGKLKVGSHGYFNYYGASSSRSCIPQQDPNSEEEDTFMQRPFLYPASSYNSALHWSHRIPNILNPSTLCDMLPVPQFAVRLMGLYFDNVGWSSHIIHRPSFEEACLNLYSAAPDRTNPQPQFLSLTYMVFCLGTLFTSPVLVRNRYSLAHEFFLRAQLCFDISVSGFTPSLDSVVAVMLMAQYSYFCDRLERTNFAWNCIGLAIRLAVAMGLHRDGEVFELSAFQLHMRRLIWSELLFFDRMLSMSLGRPFAISNDQTNVHEPSNVCDIQISSQSNCIPDPSYERTEASFTIFKAKLSKVIASVLDRAFRFTPPSYSEVEALTEQFKVLENELPDYMRISRDTPNLPPMVIIEQYSAKFLIQQALLYLHRPWFVRAATRKEEREHYKSSFNLCTSVSHELIHNLYSLMCLVPVEPLRWWVFRFHSLNAGIIQAAYALCFPNTDYALTAYNDLQYICRIFEHLKGGFMFSNKDYDFLIQLKSKVFNRFQLSSQGLTPEDLTEDVPFLHFNVPSSRPNSKSPDDSSMRAEKAAQLDGLGLSSDDLNTAQSENLPIYEQENPLLFDSLSWHVQKDDTRNDKSPLVPTWNADMMFEEEQKPIVPIDLSSMQDDQVSSLTTNEEFDPLSSFQASHSGSNFWTNMMNEMGIPK